MDIKDDGDVKKWLVRSNSKISGPNSFDQIVKAIVQGDTHILDEIQGPFERWRPIRDYSLFSAAIEKLKASTFKKREYTLTDIDARTEEVGDSFFEDTRTVDVNLDLDGSTEDIGEKTQPGVNVSSLDSDKKSSKLSQSFRGNQNIERIQSSAHRSSETVDEEGAISIQESGPRVYPRTQRTSKKSSKSFYITLALVGAFLLSIYSFLNLRQAQKLSSGAVVQEKSIEPQRNNLAKPADKAFVHTDEAEKALDQGDFGRALSEFRAAAQFRSGDPEIVMSTAALEMFFDNDISQQIANVEASIMENRLASSEKGKVIMGMGYSLLGKHKKGKKYFQQALKIQNSYFPAWTNLGYSQLMLKEYEQSVKSFTKAMQLSGQDGYYARFLLLKAQLEMGIHSQEEAIFMQVIEGAEYYQSRLKAYHFRQEVLFLKAVAKMQLGVSDSELLSAVKAFLSVDPQLVNLHGLASIWNHKSVSWDSFDGHCNNLANAMSDKYRSLVSSFCAIKNGESLQAKNKLERILEKNPRDGLAIGLLMAIQLDKEEIGADDFAKLLEKAKKASDQNLPAGIAMRACLQEMTPNIDCGNQMVVLFEKSISPLYRTWFNIEKFKNVKRTLAQQSLGDGVDLSHRFIPFMKLKQDL